MRICSITIIVYHRRALSLYQGKKKKRLFYRESPNVINGLIKVRHPAMSQFADNSFCTKSLSWKIEVHVLSRVKSAASFALSKSRYIAFSIGFTDVIEVFNLRICHVLRFRYASLYCILHHIRDVPALSICDDF